MSNPEVTFSARYTPVSALAYAGLDGAAEVVTVDKPLPVTAGASAFALPGGSIQTVSSASPMPVACGPLPESTAHIGNVFLDDVADGVVLSGSVTSATTVVSRSLAGYSGGAFQVTSSGSGCTVTYEHSVDGVTWLTMPVLISNIATGTPAVTTNANGIYSFVSGAAHVRARVSTYGSGTVAISLVLKRRPLNIFGTSLAGSNSPIGSVTVTGTATVSGTATVTGNVNTGTGYTDSVANLAAGATFTGTARANSNAQFCYFVVNAFADVAGTLFIEQSIDTGATYQVVTSASVTAGSAAQLSVRLTGAFAAATLYRVRYVNGAAAQTLFRLSSAYSAR